MTERIRHVLASGLTLVGCATDSPSHETIDVTTSVAASESAASDASTEADSTSDSGDATANPCPQRFEFGDFALVSDASFGHLGRFDMDEDGDLDAVGTRGAVLLDGVDLREIEGAPGDGTGRPGNFDGDGTADMVFAAERDGEPGFLMTPSVLDGGAPAVFTPARPSFGFDVRDYDADGVDDIASRDVDTVELWRGDGDGSFTSSSILAFPYPSAVAFLQGDESIELFVGDSVSSERLLVWSGDEFVDVESFDLNGLLTVQGLALFPTGGDQVLATTWAYNGFSVTSGVGVLHNNGGQWEYASYPLNGALPVDVSDLDLDGDGIPEVSVAHTDSEGVSGVDILCWDGGALFSCGSSIVSQIPFAIEIPSTDTGLLLSTTDDGIWRAPITSTGCGT